MASFQIDKFAEQQCLEELKDSISRNPSLAKFNSTLADDRFLLHFVRGKKYIAKDAIKSLENYFYLRQKKYNTTFKGIRPAGNPALSARHFNLLKARDPSGSLIIVGHVSRIIPSMVTHEDIFRAGVMFAEETWNFPEMEHHGFILVLNAAGFSFSHLRMWKNPFLVHKLFDIFTNSTPLRYKEIHLHGKYESIVCHIFEHDLYLLPKKMKERLRFYRDNGKELSKFHASISPQILPKSLGGKLEEDEAIDLEFEQRILDKEDYYQKFSELI